MHIKISLAQALEDNSSLGVHKGTISPEQDSIGLGRILPNSLNYKEKEVQHNQICKDSVVVAKLNNNNVSLSVELVSWSGLLSGPNTKQKVIC